MMLPGRSYKIKFINSFMNFFGSNGLCTYIGKRKYPRIHPYT